MTTCTCVETKTHTSQSRNTKRNTLVEKKQRWFNKLPHHNDTILLQPKSEKTKKRKRTRAKCVGNKHCRSTKAAHTRGPSSPRIANSLTNMCTIACLWWRCDGSRHECEHAKSSVRLEKNEHTRMQTKEEWNKSFFPT